MKKDFLGKSLLLAGTILILACSCTCQKKSEPRPPKGPEQEPFEKCECTDCECEEGASTEAPSNTETVKEEPTAENKMEEAIKVVPVVVEAVKRESPAAATASAPTETPAEVPASVEAAAPKNVEAPVAETASVAKPEAVQSAEERK